MRNVGLILAKCLWVKRLKDGAAAIVDAFYHLKNRYSEGGG